MVVGREPTRLPLIPILVLLTIVGGLALLVAGRSSPEQQIRRLIDRQIKLAVAGRYGQLHATLTPRAKAACSPQNFSAALQSLALTDPGFWSLIDFRDIRIHVSGNRAMVTYTITYNGRIVDRATSQNPDIYSRADETVYGPKPSLERALANLDLLHSNRPGLGQLVTDKEYEAQRARLLKFGTEPPLLYKKGQWYDDVDAHVNCQR